ncbi:MAG TPA: hypothetical protein DIU15_21100 [Deltaproteobacteria bacterium]|nr:hypothetical protein [Deltaproteobacteria bacterium]
MADATAQGQLKGTPAYMAPEQTLGGPLDARTDVFSMGLTLYTLATTELAFRAKKPVGVALKIARESLEPHADRLDALLPALGDVFRKACARDPDTRFADAAEMAQALRDVHASITRPQSVSAMLEMARRGAEGEPTDPAPETPTTGATDAISIDLMGPSIVEGEDEKLGHAEGARFSVGVRPEAQGGTELSVQDTDPATDAQPDAQETDPTDRFPAPRPKAEPKAEPAPRPGPRKDPSTTTGLELERAQDIPGQDPEPGQQEPSTVDGSSEAEGQPTEANTDDDDTVPPVAAPHATPGPTGAWAPPTVPVQAMSAATVPGQPAPTRGALAPPQPARPQSTGSMLGAPAPNAVGSAGPAQGLPERDYRGRVVRRTKAPENIDVGRKEKVGIAIAVGGLAIVVVALLISLVLSPSEKADSELPVQTPADLGLGPLAKRDPGDQGQRAQEALPKQPRSRFLSQEEGEADKATGSTPKPETRASASPKPPPPSAAEEQNSQATTKGARPDRPTNAPRTQSRSTGVRPKQPERTTEDAQPTSTVGSITVNSYPWSRIYIDGEDMGRTPLKARTLEVGVHTVELVFPTQGDKRFTKRVQIRPDREERVVHRLTESVNE